MNDARHVRHQEFYYDSDANYRHGSPHLSHWWLYDRLVEKMRQCLDDLRAAGMPLNVLEIGAGHGGFTEPLLAHGCDLTAVEVSRASLTELERKYGANPCFHGVLDQDRSADIGTGYSLILFVAVLHHIPDYLAFLDSVSSRLASGGSLLSLQDPLWYPRLGKATLALTRGGFYAWRLAQGDYRKGLATFSRRIRGRLDEDEPGDMVEYHVVRDGVDESAILSLLSSRFRSVEVLPYWSHQSKAIQRVGERLGAVNTFGVSASGYGPP